MVSDNGVASCIDAATGKVHWQERFEGNYSASPLFGDGKIYFQNEQGTTLVIKAEKQYQLLAKNSLDERTLASFAATDGALLLRTDKHLYRVNAPERTADVQDRSTAPAVLSAPSIQERHTETTTAESTADVQDRNTPPAPLPAPSIQERQTEATTAGALLIVGGMLFDSEHGKMVPNRGIRIESNRIAGFGSELPKDSRAQIINAEGKWIIPGLIDSHAHATFVADDAGVNPSDLLPLYLRSRHYHPS